MITFLVIWYVIGLMGCTLAAYTDHKRGHDVTVSDVLLTLLFSIFGLIVFLIAMTYFFKYNSKLNPFNFVVMKGRK